MNEPQDVKYPQLKLSHQLCFPFYATSMLITRLYQPHLSKLGLTYPQYLVLMVLWENDGLSVGELSSLLYLNTNTTTPLLKRMEVLKLIKRQRSVVDERRVDVFLTTKGKDLQEEAACIPMKLVEGISYPIEKAQYLMQEINELLTLLKSDKKGNDKSLG